MSESNRLTIIFSIALLLPFLFGTAVQGSNAATLIGTLTVHGITEPLRQATISADFAGRIMCIKKNEGAFAKKGDTILALDFEEAALDAERCRIIAESEAELTAARLKAETAKLDLTATRLVFDSTRAVSEEELWKKKLDYNLAATEYDRLTMTKAKERLEYGIAKARLTRHFVIAPYDGVVATRFLNENETCKPQEPLVKFVDIHLCRFITYVPADRSQNLTKGKQVTIMLAGSRDERQRQGTIEFVSPVIDAASGLRTVKVVFENSDGSIQPGVTGTMSIE